MCACVCVCLCGVEVRVRVNISVFASIPTTHTHPQAHTRIPPPYPLGAAATGPRHTAHAQLKALGNRFGAGMCMDGCVSVCVCMDGRI